MTVTNSNQDRNAAEPGPPVTNSTQDRNVAERMRRYRARQRGEDVPRRKPGPRPRPADLSGIPLADLVWEVADRLDHLAEPVIERNTLGNMRTDPELEALLARRGRGPLGGYGGQGSSIGTPHIVIMPASEAEAECAAADWGEQS